MLAVQSTRVYRCAFKCTNRNTVAFGQTTEIILPNTLFARSAMLPHNMEMTVDYCDVFSLSCFNLFGCPGLPEVGSLRPVTPLLPPEPLMLRCCEQIAIYICALLSSFFSDKGSVQSDENAGEDNEGLHNGQLDNNGRTLLALYITS